MTYSPGDRVKLSAAWTNVFPPSGATATVYHKPISSDDPLYCSLAIMVDRIGDHHAFLLPVHPFEIEPLA